MPITWRNVDAPTATGASRILDSAGRSFDKGIGSLSKLANQATRINTGNQKNTNRINTDNALADIGRLGSFADLDAARQNGQFENLAVGTDMNAVNKALANRGNVIDDTLSKEFQFGQREVKRAEFDGQLQFDQMLQEGNYSGASELAKTFQNPAAGLGRIEQAQQDDTNAFRKERDYREDRNYAQGAEERAANAEMQRFNNEKALFDYKNQRTSAPKETVGAEGSTATMGHLERLRVAAPNVPYFSNGGGKTGVAAINKGLQAMKSKYGRDVPSELTEIAVNNAISNMTGDNNAMASLDNSFDVDAFLKEIDDVMKRDLKGGASIRNNASELEKNNVIFNNNLERINKDRATKFRPR